jgi:hypothetical protein
LLDFLLALLFVLLPLLFVLLALLFFLLVAPPLNASGESGKVIL